jgi:hypothetical protein
MPLSDYYKIKYAILKTLFDNKEQGHKTPREMIGSERFRITESYWLDILSDLLDDGTITGLMIRKCKDTRAVSGLDDIEITGAGIDYLHDNSKMRQAYEFFQNAKDIFPLIMG